MHKISSEVIKFIKNMENWRTDNGRKKFNSGENPERDLPGRYAITNSNLFIIVMMPRNGILTKCTGRFKLHK